MPRKSRFVIDLNVKEGHEGYHTLSKCPAPLGRSNLLSCEKTLQAQGPGATRPTLTQQQQTAVTAKRTKMAMAMATKPGQAMMMNALMLWFSGSQLNIFSITTTSSAIMTPLSNLFGLEAAFKQFQDVDLQMPKLLYIALNLGWLCIGLYKMSSMRLLPTTSADWTYKIVWKEMMETTSIPPENSMIISSS